MTNEELYRLWRYAFKGIVDEYNIHEMPVTVRAADFDGSQPGGREITLIAEYKGAAGECSTSFVRSAEPFEGTLSQVLAFDIENDPYGRGIYTAVANAVMNKYKVADDCVSCPEEKEGECASHIVHHYKRHNGRVNVLLAGYQPRMLEALAAEFPVRVLDLNPENIGQTRFGVTIEHGEEDFTDAVKWAEVILCTGSALSNGTLVKYINLPKDVSFYGTTIASCARVFQLRRMCPYSGN